MDKSQSFFLVEDTNLGEVGAEGGVELLYDNSHVGRGGGQGGQGGQAPPQ